MGNADNEYKSNNMLSMASTMPCKAPEPDRWVELWFDGKMRLKGEEMTVLCIFYGMIGNPEMETAFPSDTIERARLMMNWECPPIFNLIQVFTREGELVCELDDCINRLNKQNV